MSEKKLTKGDRFNMFMRTNLQQASFNYERMHASTWYQLLKDYMIQKKNK